MEQSSKPRKMNLCFILALVASFFALLNGILWFLLDVSWIIPSEETMVTFSLVFWILGVIAIVCAAAIFVGAWVIYLYGKTTLGGKLVLVFSVLSIGTGGGFFIGFVLGVLAAYLNITKRKSPL